MLNIQNIFYINKKIIFFLLLSLFSLLYWPASGDEESNSIEYLWEPQYYGKLKGIDIRTMGSGNAGGTNALRSVGPIFALGVIFIDIFPSS